MAQETVQATRVRVQRMEPDMVHRSTGNTRIFYSRTASAFLLLIFLCSIFLLLSTRTGYTAGERDRILEESGIRYPDGFDSQTVGEVQGRAYNLYVPNKGPVSFDLHTKWENYRVIASPPWYWHDLDIQIKNGEDIKIVGSKSLGNDGRLYIVAQEMYTSSGRAITFRANDGSALWKSGLKGGLGTSSGWGPSSMGRSGIGGGYGGGPGRGRR